MTATRTSAKATDIPSVSVGDPEAPGTAAPEDASRNEVLIVGRLAAEAEQRELPSGDVLVSFRVVVTRPAPRRPPPEGVRPPTVDTLDCVVRSAGLRRRVLALAAGDVVAVEGALHRRFWRGAGGGAVSRHEIEARAVRRVRRAAR